MMKRHISAGTENESKTKKRIRGVAAVRKCKHCGHHEIDLITKGGRYVPLNPGMDVEVIKN